jgi:LPS sulfotransferase NodH
MADSDFAIIGMQRTGTTVLTHALLSNPALFVAKEIFHPEAVEPESFSIFCSKARHRSNTETIYGKFIDSLRASSRKPVIGVNVKYSSCHRLDGEWKNLTEAPHIFSIFKKRNTKVIHIVRKNMLEVAISNLVARATNVWHSEHNSLKAYEPVAIDSASVIDILKTYEREKAAFESYIQSYPWRITVFYEDMFQNGVFSERELARVSAFLGVNNIFCTTPFLTKIIPSDLSKAVLNWSDIRLKVKDAGYSRFLSGNEGNFMNNTASASAERPRETKMSDPESVEVLFPSQAPLHARTGIHDIPGEDLDLGAPFWPVPKSFLRIDPRLNGCQPLTTAFEIGEILKLRSKFRVGDYPDPYVNDISRAFRLMRGKKNYLEIGTFDRGNLAYMSTILSDDAMLIGVDTQDEPKRDSILRSFLKPGQTYHSVVGSSRNRQVVDRVRGLIGEERLDGIFIDGDHTAYGALSDYANYESMVSDEGIIFLHDSLWEGNSQYKGVADALEEINRHDQVYLIDGANPCRRFGRVMFRNENWGVVGVVFASDQTWRR